MAPIVSLEKLKTNTTATSGASTQVVAADSQRTELSLSADNAGTSPAYVLLGTGTASATNFSISLAPGARWDGRVTSSVWRGAVQLFGTGTLVGVLAA